MPATATDRLYGLTTSIAVKGPCRVATTANITLSGLQTIDGVTVAADDRVLVKDQTDATANGIYYANTSAWTRTPDFDGARDAVDGTLVIVREGSTWRRTAWELTTDDPVEIGTSALTFEQAVLNDLATASFVQAGTGAITRTGQDKERDFVSVLDWVAREDVDGTTSNQTKIEQAVAHAYANGLDLYWPHPGAKYVSTGSIANFHGVRHFGPGQILRGSDTFYVQAKDAQTNVLYVATTGSASNDGLSSAEPLTVQGAFDALPNYRPEGKWTIQLAAGTYGLENTFPTGWRGKWLVTIKGPDVGGHPNVPTAIFDGSGLTSAYAIQASGAAIRFKDLKAQDYDGGGFLMQNGLAVYENCHGANNGDSIYNRNTAYWVDGGVFSLSSGNNSCILSLMLCAHNIGRGYSETLGATTTGTNPILTGDGTGRGVHLAERSTGHVRVNVNNFAVGVDIVSSSRANLGDSNIKNNAVGVQVTDSDFVDGGTNTWNTGTADANTVNIRRRMGGTETTRDNTGVSWRTLLQDTAGYSHTGNTNETVLKTLTLKAGDFTGGATSSYAGAALRIRLYGTITGTAGTKTIRMRIGAAGSGTGGTALATVVIPATPAGVYDYEWTMFVGSGTAQNARASGAVSGGNSAKGSSLGAIDMTGSADMELNVTVQLGSAADSLSVAALTREQQG